MQLSNRNDCLVHVPHCYRFTLTRPVELHKMRSRHLLIATYCRLVPSSETEAEWQGY